MQYSIHIDGGSRGNPGPGAVGVVIQSTEHPYATIHEGGYYLGVITNNVAEYQSLLHALTLAKKLAGTSIEIFSDSQLMVRQINGQYKVKSQNLSPLHKQAKLKLSEFENWKMTHVLRNANKRADELVNMALDLGEDVVIGDDNTSTKKTEPAAHPPDQGQYAVDLAGSPGRHCPAQYRANHRFVFGPTLPGQCCMHAAKAILNAIDLHERNVNAKAVCDHCQVPIAIKSI